MKAFYLLCALSLSLPAYAQDDDVAEPKGWDFSQPYKDKCSEGNMHDMNECLVNEYIEIDQTLNSVYNMLVSVLAEKTKLQKAQAAWIKFRDLNCDYENSGMTPADNIYPYGMNACRIDLTLKRIKDLREYISDDWSCNGCPPRK